MKTLRVAAGSKTTSLAGAIAWSIRQDREVQLVAIGAGAVNQATKAIATARAYLAPEGLDLYLIPAFITVSTAGDEERTALQLDVFSRQIAIPEEEILEGTAESA